MAALGDVLKYYRKRAGLSQAEAADLLGISRSTLIKYEEKGSNHRLPISIFIQMTEIYDIDSEEIEKRLVRVLRGRVDLTFTSPCDIMYT